MTGNSITTMYTSIVMRTKLNEGKHFGIGLIYLRSIFWLPKLAFLSVSAVL